MRNKPCWVIWFHGSRGYHGNVSKVSRKNGLRCVSFIGDADSSTFQTIEDAKPYGDDIIVKRECVGHVQKRLGTRLRKLKSSYSKKKLSDGKGISGKGRLTDKMIDTM